MIATRPYEVSVAPFRERFHDLERRGVIAADIARSLGWFDENDRADGPRVRRTLGLRPYLSHGQWRRREAVTRAMATQLCDALGIDPHEVGL